MFVATSILVIMAIILGVLTYRQDPAKVAQGLRDGGTVLLKQTPLLVAAFIIAGYLEVLIPPELIRSWLGVEAGIKGVIIGSIAGGIIPSGPYVAFPIISVMYKAGASLATAIAFVTGWMFWSTSRLPFELALFGPRFSILRMGLFLLFPPLAGIIVLLCGG
jgi:uncharacterized membrane protein YraQ (UPF0718 family)